METHHGIPYIREAVLFLVASGIILPLVHRLRISPVLGYLVIGVIIGPFGLGLLADEFGWLAHFVISDLEGVQALAELGVVFLLFMIGLELSLERLWAMRRLVFGLGGLQVVLSGAAIGGIALTLGAEAPAAMVLGACLALSSTAIVMQLLIEQRRMGTTAGRASFSILLLQDQAVVPIMFMVGVFGKSGEEGGVLVGLAVAFGKALLAMALVFIVGRLVLRHLFRFVAQTRSAEMFMAAVLLVAIGTATLTGLAGLSMALGAFLAGLLLGETEYAHEIEVDIEPFKGLMLGLFFMSVGMGLDIRVIGDQILWLGLAVVGLFAVKAVIAGGLCRAFGLSTPVALETGLLLGQGGEFAFVVIVLAMSLGLVGGDLGQFVLIVAGLSMMVTPPVAGLGRRLSARLERRHDATRQDGALAALGKLEGHVIIAGFGRVGQTLGRILDREHVSYIALDSNAIETSQMRARGLPVYYGDVSRPQMLHRARAGHASALVLTMDDAAASERVVKTVRREWPELPVLARARDPVHAARLLKDGATAVVPETVEASLQLGSQLLTALGVPDEVCHKRIDAERHAEIEKLKA